MPLTSLSAANGTRGGRRIVGRHRLVTLTGPAGVGKTRLALRLAAGPESFPTGPACRPGAGRGELVGDTLARALGVVPQPGWSLRDGLREAAASIGCLLVLDNCEHVIGEAAEIVADLLAVGGRLRVLATSREPLGVPAEVTYPVPSLPVPPASARPRGTPVPTTPYACSSTARRRRHPASPSPTTIAAAVAALCRRLDGLPLAIELAASRVRRFEPAELVAHLDQRFELLSAGARTALPRQQTLRGAIDWSYDLLDDEERTLFDRSACSPPTSTSTPPGRCAGRTTDGRAVITCCRGWWTSRW